LLRHRLNVIGINVIHTINPGFGVNAIPGRMVMKMFENS